MSIERLIDIGVEIISLAGLFTATLVISGHSCTKANTKADCDRQVPGMSQACK
jgi:hypothetical protein